MLTSVDSGISPQVLAAIVEAGNLEQPGVGIAFILPVKGVVGICHLAALILRNGAKVWRGGR